MNGDSGLGAPESLPETVQIAKLLAELMPSSSSRLSKQTPREKRMLGAATDSGVESKAPAPLAAESIAPQSGPATVSIAESTAPPQQAPPAPADAWASPAHVEQGSPIAREREAPQSAIAAQAPSRIADLLSQRLIPLGELTVAGYFALINWRNDPDAVKHPYRPLPYDETILAELTAIPFFEIERPPANDAWSVAAVLKSFDW